MFSGFCVFSRFGPQSWFGFDGVGVYGFQCKASRLEIFVPKESRGLIIGSRGS